MLKQDKEQSGKQKTSILQRVKQEVSINKLRGASKKVVAGVITAVLIAVVGIGLVYLLLTASNKLSNNDENFKIGDVTITSANIDDYVKELEKIKQETPSAIVEGDLRQKAIDALVLNAAFKAEEKKLNQSLSDQEITKSTGMTFKNAQEEKAYYDQYRTPQRTLRIVNMENEAYKLKYADQLIAKKDLLVAGINLDTPFFNKLPDNAVQGQYDASRARLDNDIRGLMKQKASNDEIAKKADVIRYDDNPQDDTNFQQYFDKAVITLDLKKGYRQDAANFNDTDETSYIRGKVGDLVDIDDKIAELKNNGDYSEVFMAKTGTLTVVRLEGKNGGAYSSWTDFLDSYKNKSGNRGKKLGVMLKNKFMESANSAMYTLTSPGLEEANAQAGGCSTHTVTFRVRAVDISSGTALSGAKIEIYRPAAEATCGGISGTRELTSGSNAYANDNCLQSAPRFTKVADPAGYGRDDPPAGGGGYRQKHSGVDPPAYNPYYFRPGGQPGDENVPRNTQSSNIWNYFGDENSGVLDPGWPEWTPEQINAVHSVTILLRYNYQSPPSCTPEPCKPCPGQPQQPCGENGKFEISLTCSRISGTIAANKKYKIFVGYVSNDTTLKEGVAGSQGTYGVDYNGAAYFNNYNTVKFILKTYTGPNNGDYSNSDATYESNQSLDCVDDAPTMYADADCNGVYIRGMYDADAPNATMSYYGVVYHRGTSSAATSFSGNAFRDADVGYNATPNQNDGWTIHVGVHNVTPGGGGGAFNALIAIDISGACYQASCDLNVVPNVPGTSNGVKSNRDFNVVATLSRVAGAVNSTVYQFGTPNVITGTHAVSSASYLPSSMGPHRLSLTNDGEPWTTGPKYFDEGPTTKTITDTADGTQAEVGSYSLTYYPDYYGRFRLGGACSKPVSVYKPFMLTPTAQNPDPTPNREDPSTIKYTVGVNQATGSFEGSPYYNGTIPATVTARLMYYKQGTYDNPDLNSRVFNGNYGNASYSSADGLQFDDATPGPQFRPGDTWSPGDRFCARAEINRYKGWVGPSGALADVSSNAAQTCEQIVNNPYIRVYGNDVAGGGQFGGTGGTAGIKAYLEEGSSGAGSGVEFAAYAVSAIEGFATATLRTSGVPLPANGLSFANMGGMSRAVPDYYKDGLKPQTPEVTTSVLMLNSGAVVDNEQTRIKTPSLVLNPGAGDGVGFNKHHAIFVEGDVIIRNNIIYSSPGGWANIGAIPAFDLIVKGNIFIADNVTQLDGNYIAQPNGATGGKIFTCATASGALYSDPTQLYNNCKNKLTVNGSVVAQDLRLLRTYKTLRDIPYNDSVVPRVYARETFGTDNASESFRMTPESFLARRSLRPEGSQTNGKFDYYVTLPPVL